MCLQSPSGRTFGEVASDLPPLSDIVVEDDAALIHADAAESLLAPEPRCVLPALQHVVHGRCPDG